VECPKCHAKMRNINSSIGSAYHGAESTPTITSGWSCEPAGCGTWIDANDPPVCPMPPKEHTRHPDGKGGFIRQINHLTGLDRLVWDYRNTIRTLGRTPKEIATKLNELRPGSRLNGNMVAASLNRLENGQIEKKVREEA